MLCIVKEWLFIVGVIWNTIQYLDKYVSFIVRSGGMYFNHQAVKG